MRRSIWVGVVILVVVAVAIPLWLVLDGGDRRTAALSTGEQAIGGQWALLMDGSKFPVQSVAGCEVQAPVNVATSGAGTNKFPGQPATAPCTLQVDLSAKPLLDWVKATMDGNPTQKNLELIARDITTGAVTAHVLLHDAFVTRFEIPRFATNAKSVLLSVTVRPSRAESATLNTTFPSLKETSVLLAPSTAELDLSAIGLKMNWTNVPALTAPTLVQRFSEVQEGSTKDQLLVAGPQEFGDLVVHAGGTKDQDLAAALQNHFTSVVINGNALEGTGVLTIWDEKKVRYVRLSMTGVGIFGADPIPRADAARRFGFYVETATLTVQ